MNFKRLVSSVFSDPFQGVPGEMFSGILPAGRGDPPKYGTNEFLKAYSQMPWLRSVVGKVSTAVASAEWKLYGVQTNGKYVQRTTVQRAFYSNRRKQLQQYKAAGELKEITDHPMLTAINASNPFMVGSEVRQLIQAYLDLVGEAYAIKQRNIAGVPIGLWPIPPSWVKEIPVPDKPFYTVSFRGWNGQIPEHEVISFKVVSPDNPYSRGSGISQSLDDELEIDEYAAKHIKTFFYNRARPDLLIYGKGLTPEDTRRLEMDWASKNQGFYRAYRPYFLNKEIQIKEFAQDFESMQLVELRKQERDMIRQIFGVPPEILGITESSNRATIDAADYIFGKHVVIPRLEYLRVVLQERLAIEYDDRLIVDYESPLEEDREFKLKVMQALPYAYMIDEWRELADEEPIEDGSGRVYAVPTNLQTVTSLNDVQPIINQPNPNSGQAKAKTIESEGENRPPFGYTSLKAGSTRTPTNQEIATKLEPKFEEVLRKAAGTIRDTIDLGTLETAIRNGNVLDILRKAGLDDLINELQGYGDHTQTAVSNGGLAASQRLRTDAGIDYSFDIKNPEAVKWAKEHSAQLIRAVDESCREAVRQIIANAIENGGHPYQTARQIQQVIGLDPRRASAHANYLQRLLDDGTEQEAALKKSDKYGQRLLRQRAQTIARTETLSSVNMGQQVSWNDAMAKGLLNHETTYKEWIITHDDRLDPSICAPVPGLKENEKVKVDGFFTLGKGKRRQQPPAHPNCRCTTGLKFAEDETPITDKKFSELKDSQEIVDWLKAKHPNAIYSDDLATMPFETLQESIGTLEEILDRFPQFPVPDVEYSNPQKQGLPSTYDYAYAWAGPVGASTDATRKKITLNEKYFGKKPADLRALYQSNKDSYFHPPVKNARTAGGELIAHEYGHVLMGWLKGGFLRNNPQMSEAFDNFIKRNKVAMKKVSTYAQESEQEAFAEFFCQWFLDGATHDMLSVREAQQRWERFLKRQNLE